MKILVALHLIFLLAPNDASPSLAPNGSVYITNGASLVLTCETDQDVARVWWKRNNFTIIVVTNTTVCSFSKFTSLDTYNYSMTCDRQRMFTLVRYRVNSSDDNSIWTCQMYLPNNTDLGTSTPVRVLMHVPVRSAELLNGTTLTLTENQSSVLVCETDACRPSAAIYWMKDGRNITNYTTSVTTINMGSDLFVSIGTLTYTGQRVDNRKILTCGAYNDFASTQTSRNLTVIIYYPPEDPPVIDGRANGSNLTVIENISQILTCRIIGGNPLANLSWNCLGHIGLLSTAGETVISTIVLSVNRSAQDKRCTCRSSHQVDGNKDIFVSLQVHYPPSIEGLINTYNVIEYESLNVKCRVNSNPPPDQISWSPIGDSSVPSTLYLSSVLRNQSGTYICKAHNMMVSTDGTQLNGTTTSQIQVDVLYPPLIQGLTSPYKVIENQPLSVTCKASSKPPPDSISWSPNGEGSLPSLLYFSSLSRNKSGIYSCTAQNSMIQTDGMRRNGTITSRIQVDVLYPPSIGGLTSTYKVIEYQPLNVTCKVNSNPPPYHISWSPIGEGFVPSKLYFSSISRDKSRTYSCTAQNTMITTDGTRQNGTITSQIQVDVLYPPSIQRLTSPYKVEENKPLSVPCEVNSNPPADQVSWSPSGEGSVPSTLYFSSVSRNQSGIYMCTAQNTMIQTDGIRWNGTNTSQIQVDVLYGAEIVNLSVQDGNIVNENSSAFFKCHVDSNPPSTITWMKESSSAVLHTDSGVVQSQYRIESAECLNMGNYTCSAYNGIWTTAKERLELFVRCHPRTDYRLNISTKIYKRLYEAAVLYYTVISYPLPKFNWTFLGNGSVSRDLPTSASQRDDGYQSELSFTSLGIDDFGNYSVIADNSLPPSARVVFEIIPADVPEVPSYVMIIEITQTQVKVQWMAGNSGGPQQTFHVVASVGSLTHNVTVADPGYRQNGTAVIEGLQPGTKYSIYMVATNSVGSSNMTKAIIVTTLEVITPDSSSTFSLPAAAGGIGAGVVVILMAVVALFLWRRYHHRSQHTDGTQINQINAKSVRHDAANGQDYEGLHINNTEASPYLQLNDITLESNRYANTRPPENDSYEKLHPYTNSDIQMYSSLKIPKTSKEFSCTGSGCRSTTLQMPPTLGGLMDLDEEVNLLWNQALSPATQIAYNSAFNVFRTFMLMCGFASHMQLLPDITENTLIYFVTHCARALNLKHSTIKLYLCGIRFKYMQAGIQSPFTTDRNNMPRLATILKAIKKTQGTSAKLRKPITYNILTSICTVLRGGVFDAHTDLLLLTVCIVAFFGFLRCGEFTIRDFFDPTIHLCVGDVHFQQETAFLKLKSSKTDPFRRGVTIQLHATGRALCPYSALTNFMLFRRRSSSRFDAPLFITSTGQALSRVVFLNHMQLVYRKIGLDTSQYSGHSFRIGAATSAAAAHLEDHMIKVLGRWSSDCYSRYIRTPPGTIRSAQRAMAMDADITTQ